VKELETQGGYQVGEWTVDPVTGEVHAASPEGGVERRRVLEPRVVRLLGYLARNAGRIVAKEELIDSVWDGAFVTDHALWRAISRLREALEDDPRAPRVLETLPRRGYRLIAAVSFAQDGVAPAARPVAGRTRQAWSAQAAVAAAVVVLVVAGVVARNVGKRPPVSPSRVSAAGWAANAAAIEELEARLRERGEEPELLAALTEAYAARWFRYSSSIADHRWASAALVTADRALALAPDSPAVLEARGQAMHAVGRESDAIAAYRRAVELGPERLSAATGLAHALRDAGALAESELWHRRVLERDPTSHASRVGLARTLLLEGEYAAADRQLEQVLAEARAVSGREPHAAALRLRAALLRGRRGEARSLAAAFAVEYGADPTVLEAAAGVAQLDGRLEEAHRLLLRATADDHKGGNGAAFLRLASVLAAQGDRRTSEGILGVFADWSATVDSGGSDHWRGAYWRAASASIRGDGGGAARHLAVAIDRGFSDYAWVAIDPIWSGLRRDPEAAGLLERMRGLAAGLGEPGPSEPRAAGAFAPVRG
jgi:DNA-binding winged helix-turn-helix (wHTH) protein/Tfp pilus assembly protein PilF